jgi:pyrimidine operon attenuation protein / uracil phosphoribosyltransferase
MKVLKNSDAFQVSIKELVQTISKKHSDFSKVAIIGIHTRGVPMARRMAELMAEEGNKVNLGYLDINLYRDDLSEIADQPVIKETKIEFDVSDKVVYLVDDVLYTGRTIRAGMNVLFDLGRPTEVHLVVMAKRNGRELPIDTEYFGLYEDTKESDNIKVKFKEIDGEDGVVLLEEGEY